MEENIKKNQSEFPIISLVFGSISFLFCLIIIFLHSFIHLLIAIDFLFIFSVLGLILGIISKTRKYEPKVISTLSIIFSSIASVVSVIIFIIFIGIPVINSSDIIARTTELVTNIMSESDVSYKHYVEHEEDDEQLGWYKSIGTIHSETFEEPPAIVRATVYLGYKYNDKSVSDEINSKSREIKEFLQLYFHEKTAAELMNVDNEEIFKNEIRNTINEKILSISKIQSISFDQLDIILQN